MIKRLLATLTIAASLATPAVFTAGTAAHADPVGGCLTGYAAITSQNLGSGVSTTRCVKKGTTINLNNEWVRGVRLNGTTTVGMNVYWWKTAWGLSFPRDAVAIWSGRTYVTATKPLPGIAGYITNDPTNGVQIFTAQAVSVV